MYTEFLCHNILFRFESAFYLFDHWKWKLDQWIFIKDTTDIIFDDTVNIEINEKIDVDGDKLLYSDNEGFFESRVYESDQYGTIWELVRKSDNTIILKCLVDNEYRNIVFVKDMTYTNGQSRFEFLARITPSVFLHNGMLTFHGVLLEYNNVGIIISAPSGTGKTTHARLWRNLKNALIINGDRVVAKKIDNAWVGFGLPWSGTSGEQINRRVSIKAMVILEQAEENTVDELTGINKFFTAYAHIIYPQWDSDLNEKAIDYLNLFIQDVSVFHLKCRPDCEAVEVLCNALFPE